MTTLRPVTMAAIAAILVVGPAIAGEHPGPHWTYDGKNGPTHWASLDAAFGTCQAGKHQSPIDIRGAKAGDLPAITFSYQPTPLKVVDNGHTVSVTYAPGSFITVGDQRYELQQLHFHHPSEEKVNGISYPLVAHLVHANAEGKLAVVAVLMANGKANDFITNVWKHVPAGEGEAAPDGVSVDASGLLPPAHGYYTFTGSLTTPPCTEDVTWFVLRDPEPVSSAQVAVFAKRYPHNNRPVQSLNGRTVLMSK